jgi:hypothetical protein
LIRNSKEYYKNKNKFKLYFIKQKIYLPSHIKDFIYLFIKLKFLRNYTKQNKKQIRKRSLKFFEINIFFLGFKKGKSNFFNIFFTFEFLKYNFNSL